MPSKQPNVIVVLCDELRAFEVGCYGNSVIRTPHIDRLAAQGVRFETAVTNNPVCVAARSCLMTGQYSRTCTGEVNNVASEPPTLTRRRLVDQTMAECFRQEGYQTTLIGKWHMDPDPRIVGFDHAYYPLALHRYHRQRYFTNGVIGPTIEQFAPDHERDKVDAYLASRTDEPFFLYYNISPPHAPIGPIEMPANYVNAYDRSAMPIRPNAFRDGAMAYDEKWFKAYTIYDYFWRTMGVKPWDALAELGYPPTGGGELPSDAMPAGFDLRDLYALYYGATTWVDDLVGAMMGSLARHGLEENTLVLFMSDHGDNLGSHQLFNKDCLYEESIRVPCVLWHPASLSPQVNRTQIISLIDIMPTLLDLCGLEVPASVQGQSLASVACGMEKAAKRNVAFIETNPFHFGRPTVGLRTPSHLYGAFTEGQAGPLAERWGLFRLNDDPLEDRNLPDSAPEAPALRAELNAWHESTPWLKVRG